MTFIFDIILACVLVLGSIGVVNDYKKNDN